MAIINSLRSTKKEKLKIDINSEIASEIKAYCQWANIDDISYFIEEAACFVFAKDKDWKQQQKAIKRTSKAK